MVFQPPMLNIVAKSPFKILQNHMRHCYETVVSLDRFIQVVLTEDWQEAEQCLLSISADESTADALKIDVCNHLHKDLFLPVPKAHILSLLMQQESLANLSEDIAGLIFGRRMVFPRDIGGDIAALMQNALSASKKANTAIAALSQFLESGFSGSEQQITEQIIADINKIESDSDRLQREIRSKLFAQEAGLPAVQAIFLYEVIDNLGGLADIAQKVGLQLIILVSR